MTKSTICATCAEQGNKLTYDDKTYRVKCRGCRLTTTRITNRLTLCEACLKKISPKHVLDLKAFKEELKLVYERRGRKSS